VAPLNEILDSDIPAGDAMRLLTRGPIDLKLAHPRGNLLKCSIRTGFRD
jgi:hypothetical protein